MFLKTISFSNRIKFARIFFILSSLYGLFLRLYKIVDFIPIAYKNILQTHSHIAFLGWGFMAVITLISFSFFSEKTLESKYINTLYRILVFSIFGMLISFPLQGYKVFSIIFLTVFLIASYTYLSKLISLFKQDKTLSAKFVKTGIYFYFLSSIAIWFIGIISSIYGKTILYHNTIYFYLHFLYNGFFVFSLFGIFFRYLEKNNYKDTENTIQKFYVVTSVACIPAYSLSLLWTDVPNYVYIIGFIAATLQLISLSYLYKIVKEFYKKQLSTLIKRITIFLFTAYFLKIIMQFSSVFPIVFQKALQVKQYFIIGYIHLFTLGFMSLFIILLLLLIPKKNSNKYGIYTFMFGVFLSELLLFLQGLLNLYLINIPKYDILLFFASALMPLGILIIQYNESNFKKKFIK